MTTEMYLQRGKQFFIRLASDERARKWAKAAVWAGAGFLLSAASLGNAPQPFAMGLVSALTGWRAGIVALGSMAGYGFFWGSQGLQGVVWAALACLTSLFLGKRKLIEDSPLIIPALSGLWVSVTGLLFQISMREDTATGIYLMRIFLAAAGSRLFALVFRRRDPILDWISCGVAVLALAQVVPLPFLGLGYIAGSALAVTQAFPAAAAAGLALDLSRVTRVPMTAVLCSVYLTRLIPGIPKWGRQILPGAVYLLVMGLTGTRDYAPLVGMILGGLLSGFLPQRPEISHRRGETGMAQVRLEVMAGVLSQTRQLLLDTAEAPIDEAALLAKAKERSCGGCPNRKACTKLGPIPGELLHKPMFDNTSLPFSCRKPGRMVLELRRTQEQYRNLKADRDRRREYREALVQQYQFLSDYLRDTSDSLPQRGKRQLQRFRVDSGIASIGREAANGDRVLRFHGAGCRYYVLLCDGMGTGLGAAEEGKTAGELLKQMLIAGFPAEYALRSLNSLLALRGKAGAVTIDLAQIHLDTGRGSLYKWGAAPSYLLTKTGAEKIGTAGPPPGIHIGNTRETVDRLSLRRGEALILLSDGVDGEAVRLAGGGAPGEPPGELAAKLLELAAAEPADDATVAVIRLVPASLST